MAYKSILCALTCIVAFVIGGPTAGEQGSLSGVVRDLGSEEMAGIVAVRVEVYLDSENEIRTAIAMTLTAENGSYTIPGVPKGEPLKLLFKKVAYKDYPTIRQATLVQDNHTQDDVYLLKDEQEPQYYGMAAKNLFQQFSDGKIGGLSIVWTLPEDTRAIVLKKLDDFYWDTHAFRIHVAGEPWELDLLKRRIEVFIAERDELELPA